MDYLESKDLIKESDGTFEIILSASRPEDSRCKNWLKLARDPVEGLFILRQTFGDRASETAATVRTALMYRTVRFQHDAQHLRVFPPPI